MGQWQTDGETDLSIETAGCGFGAGIWKVCLLRDYTGDEKGPAQCIRRRLSIKQVEGEEGWRHFISAIPLFSGYFSFISIVSAVGFLSQPMFL